MCRSPGGTPDDAGEDRGERGPWTSPQIADITEIEQLLARYAVGMTRDDIDAVDRRLHPRRDLQRLRRHLHPRATSPPWSRPRPRASSSPARRSLELDGDAGTGTQTLCFVDQTTHDMRIGWYTDTYRRTAQGWRLQHPGHDLPPAQRRPRLGQGRTTRPGPRPRRTRPAERRAQWSSTSSSRPSTPGSTSTRASSPPTFEGIGTLDEQMAQLRKVMRLTYDAGFMRMGWPERVGGLGGSNLLRAYLGEALTARDLVEPGIYSMPEVLAPTMIDYAPAGARGRHGAARCCAARRSGARASPSRAPAATWPRSPAGRRATATAGGSTARRCGRAWPSTRSAACS